jgi:hypothetical protein
MNASLTVSAALLVFQFFFSAILAIGVSIISRGYNPHHGIRIQRARNPTSLLFLILAITFATIGPILATNSFATTWTPVYGAALHGGLPVDAVKAWVFVLDLALVSVIIGKTGGWKASPFPSLNFSIPAIAILLGDSGFKVAIYTTLLALIFGGSLAYSRSQGLASESGRSEDDVALWVVAVSALALTTAIGVFTHRPP